jgi:hypothetical protein
VKISPKCGSNWSINSSRGPGRVAHVNEEMNYTSLSFADLRSALPDVARDARSTFGDLGVAQLNWRPDATRWSVAQCFQHLLTANRLMLRAAGGKAILSLATLAQDDSMLKELLRDDDLSS